MQFTDVRELSPQQVLVEIKALEDKKGITGKKRTRHRRRGHIRAKENGSYKKRN